MKKLFKYLVLFLKHGLFLIITSLIPKKKNLWVFGCWEGRIYADNAKYLFEWVENNHKEIHCVWITRSASVYNSLVQNGHDCVLFPSARAFFILARAKVTIETEGNVDIGGYRPGRIKVIQLWHGVAPKKMEWKKKYNAIENFFINLIYDNHKKSHWMVSSEQNKGIMMGFFGMPDKNVYVTGYPRNDALLNNKNSDITDELEQKYPNSRKLIYMPTHRAFGSSNQSIFTQKDLIALDELLIKNNMVMLFKPHIHELKNYLQFENHLRNIIFAKGESKFDDVYRYVGSFDLLICDYSSIEYDFLVTKKPIVVFPFDLEKFRKTDGLFDYFEDIPCGPFCYSWQEVVESADKLLNNDTWFENREKCRLIFHPFDDGLNSERVYESIIKICNM